MPDASSDLPPPPRTGSDADLGTGAASAGLPDPPSARAEASGAAPEFAYTGRRFMLGVGSDFFGVWDRRAPGPPVHRAPRDDAGWAEIWSAFVAREPRWRDLGQVSIPPRPTPPMEDDGVRFLRSSMRYLLGETRSAYGVWDRSSPGPPLIRSAASDEGWAHIWRQYQAWAPNSVGGLRVEAPADPPQPAPAIAPAHPAEPAKDEPVPIGEAPPLSTCVACGGVNALMCAGVFTPHVPIPQRWGDEGPWCPICGRLPGMMTCERCGARQAVHLVADDAGDAAAVPRAAGDRRPQHPIAAQLFKAAMTKFAEEFGKEAGAAAFESMREE